MLRLVLAWTTSRSAAGRVQIWLASLSMSSEICGSIWMTLESEAFGGVR